MSFNFTGSTKRKNVNLGNRSLGDKNNFLLKAKLEREKREAERKTYNAAVVIQSAIRRYIDLRDTKLQMAKEWDRKNTYQFKFSFPEFIKRCSLAEIEDFMYNLPGVYVFEDDEIGAREALISGFLELIERFVYTKNEAYFTAEFHEIKNDILDVISSLFFGNRKINNKKFLDVLFYLYFEESDIQAFDFILKGADNFETNLLFDILFKTEDGVYAPKRNITEDAINKKLEYEFQKFFFQISYYFLSENLTTSIPLLCFAADAVQRFSKYERNYYIQTIAVTYAITFRYTLSVSNRTTKVSNTQDFWVKEAKDEIIISNQVFESFKFFYQYKKIYDWTKFKSKETPILINHVCFLLIFASTFERKEANVLKSLTDLNWIISEQNSEIMKDSFKYLSEFEEFKSLNSILIENNKSSFEDDDNCHWLISLEVFSEFMLSMLSLSSDEAFYTSILISKDDLINFTKFLKFFVTDMLYNKKTSKMAELNAPIVMKIFKKVLLLTKKLYLKDMKMNFMGDKSFWLLQVMDLDENFMINLLRLMKPMQGAIKAMQDTMKTSSVELFEYIPTSVRQLLPNKMLESFYILRYAPYMIPFETRAAMFHELINIDKLDNDLNEWYPEKPEGIVSRDNVLFDSYKYFGNLKGRDIKLPFSVQFINQFGEVEAGIDGGGLTKELLTALTTSTFIPSLENRKMNKGLQFFKEGTHHKLYPNPELFFKIMYQREHPEEEIEYAVSDTEYLNMMRFLGMIIGKCLYDNVLLDISFCSFFLKLCCSSTGDDDTKDDFSNSFDELKNLDESLYNSLNYVLKQTDDFKFEQMSLEFLIDDDFYDMNLQKRHVEIPLLPLVPKEPGLEPAPVPVTNSNKLNFIRLVTAFRLSKQFKVISDAFIDGLFQVIDPFWLSIFSPFELQTLISGDDEDIDIDDLEKNVIYGGGYSENSQTIIDLFQVLREFDNDNKAKFIKFVTSSPKQPLLGFSELNPKFGINRAGEDCQRLPTAGTCVNLLKLPDYKDKELLRNKLLYSISSKAGFDLS